MAFPDREVERRRIARPEPFVMPQPQEPQRHEQPTPQREREPEPVKR